MPDKSAIEKERALLFGYLLSKLISVKEHISPEQVTAGVGGKLSLDNFVEELAEMHVFCKQALEAAQKGNREETVKYLVQAKLQKDKVYTVFPPGILFIIPENIRTALTQYVSTKYEAHESSALAYLDTPKN